MFSSWWRRWCNGTTGPAGRGSGASRRRFHRPQLERLEERIALSTFRWTTDVGGDWENSSNWVLISGITGVGFPDAPDDVAQFFNTNSTLTTVGINSPITVGQIQFDSPQSYFITGNVPVASLTFDVTAGNAAITVTNNNGTGTHDIGLPTRLLDNLDVNVAALCTLHMFSGTPISGPGGLTKGGDGTLSLGGSNSYAGVTRVNQGFLDLVTTSGTPPVPGTLIVGDGVGTDVVEAFFGNNIADTSAVTVNSSGVLEIDTAETIGSLSGTGSVTLGWSAVAGALTTGGNNLDAVFNGVISGNPGSTFTKIGSGTQTLGGNNSYDGPTTINGGALLIDGSQPQSPVLVNSGATLGGTGVAGPTTVGGGARLAPGDAGPGILTVQGGISFQPGSVFAVEVAGLTPGSGYDQLRVLGPVLLNAVALSVSFGVPVFPNDTFTFLSNDGTDPVVGIFNGLPEESVTSIQGSCFQISYQGGDGNDVELVDMSRNRLFVTGLSVDLLRRFPTRVELALWVPRLDSGQLSRVQVASDFWGLPEHRRLEVAALYQAAGVPDDGRQPVYVALLVGGLAREGDILASILTAPAFRRGHRSSRSFVQALFGMVNGRPGKNSESAFWQGVLDSGLRSRRRVVLLFLSSSESLRQAITQNFQEFLGHGPSALDVQLLLPRLQAGLETPQTLSASILARDGYIDRLMARCAAGTLIPLEHL
jgi:autotransporter-associated beta strand protein